MAVSAKISNSLVKSCVLCDTPPEYRQCVSPEHPVRLAAKMPGVAEKARFYLERSVPQLREWEEKEIFSKVSPSSCPTPQSCLVNPSNRRRKFAPSSRSETTTSIEFYRRATNHRTGPPTQNGSSLSTLSARNAASALGSAISTRPTPARAASWASTSAASTGTRRARRCGASIWPTRTASRRPSGSGGR